MDEEQLESSLDTYKMQLSQVDAALLASGEKNNQDLTKLREDLQELISLTEESLLKLKKEKLLSMLDSAGGASSSSKPQNRSSEGGHTSTNSDILGSCSSGIKTSSTPEDTLDAEFAAFKASLGEDVTTNRSSAGLSDSSDSSSSEDEAVNSSRVTEDVFKDIIGSRCRAPFSHSWGEQSYHNAMVISVELEDTSGSEGEEEEGSEPRAMILFTNPTHRSMVPCQYFLDDRCTYGDRCRFSHGHPVQLSKLKEYRQPDYSCLKLESKVLAQYTDRVWYPAMVVDQFPDNTMKVMFETNDEVITVKMEDVLPQDIQQSSDDNDKESSPCSDSEADDAVVQSSESEDEELPVYLWRPGQNKDLMGQWEQHTKGIASKLMQKMGYVSGQGLGRDGQGRAEPVPIQLLPQGKSLDKIMELKLLAGDRDLYDVMKRREKHQRKVEAKNKDSYRKETEREKEATSVFDFINKKLHPPHPPHTKKGNHGNHKHHSHHSNSVNHISVKDLKSKSDKSLNIQLFQTMEEIKSTEKEINRLKSALNRNQQVDPVFSSNIQSKLVPLQKYLDQLKKSEHSLERHKESRSSKKKLSVF